MSGSMSEFNDLMVVIGTLIPIRKWSDFFPSWSESKQKLFVANHI